MKFFIKRYELYKYKYRKNSITNYYLIIIEFFSFLCYSNTIIRCLRLQTFISIFLNFYYYFYILYKYYFFLSYILY